MRGSSCTLQAKRSERGSSARNQQEIMVYGAGKGRKPLTSWDPASSAHREAHHVARPRAAVARGIAQAAGQRRTVSTLLLALRLRQFAPAFSGTRTLVFVWFENSAFSGRMEGITLSLLVFILHKFINYYDYYYYYYYKVIPIMYNTTSSPVKHTKAPKISPP